MNEIKKQAENDQIALVWISRFRWLRAKELGSFIWPEDAFSHTRANRLIRQLLKRQLVGIQQLPHRAGFAVALTKQGAQLLKAQGIYARTGRSLGSLKNGNWTPPADWQHHLLTLNVMSDLHRQGFTLITEEEIRAAHSRLAKIPDGLAIKGGTIYWLEVENARKTGRPLTQLATTFARITANDGPVINGMRANKIIVAYLENDQDDRGHALNHAVRIKNALQRVSPYDVPLCWAVCHDQSHDVGHIEWREEVIESSHAERIFIKMKQTGWRIAQGDVHTNTFHQWRAYVWEMPDEQLWYAQINDETAVAAMSCSAAKRLCADSIAKEMAN